MPDTPRVLHCKRDDSLHAIYVGRPSKWGNPYHVGPDGTREEVIAKYHRYILTKPKLLDQLGELRGKDLSCWCGPTLCHADILLELANA